MKRSSSLELHLMSMLSVREDGLQPLLQSLFLAHDILANSPPSEAGKVKSKVTHPVELHIRPTKTSFETLENSPFEAEMTLWRRPRSPDWVELDQRFDEMSRRIDRALEECRRDMRRFEESFFPASRYGEGQKVINDDRKFAVTLDVSQFHPDEVKVNLEGRDLVIEGRQEHKNDRSYSKRSFVRKWRLPDEANIDAINSSLSDSGRLSVEIPKFPSAKVDRRSVPVTQTRSKQRETNIN
ncbi:hypothetical protein RB195_011816 [Necator americanus]|uniref:SHSP domain-containing protein n=1 Tax=Necator americanus TaxID=51031 RepID=A0ABR1D7D5_NECAM